MLYNITLKDLENFSKNHPFKMIWIDTGENIGMFILKGDIEELKSRLDLLNMLIINYDGKTN